MSNNYDFGKALATLPIFLFLAGEGGSEPGRSDGGGATALAVAAALNKIGRASCRERVSSPV